MRQLAVSGGLYLILREAAGMLVRLGGVVAVTRLLGPTRYGIYFGAASFVTVVATAAQMGSEVWLIRQREEPTAELYQQVFSTLAVVSLMVTGVSLAVSYALSSLLPTASLHAFRLLLISIPVNVLWAPAQAKIERRFGYRQMAWLELGGDVVLYATAVPLAFAGLGQSALIVGYIAWQAFLLVASLQMAHIRPRWCWSGSVSRDLVRHGIGYSSSDWFQRLGALTVPVIVGAVAGNRGVGLYGLAFRLVDTAGFGLRATWRLGMATMSRLTDDVARLRRTLEEGMVAQILVLGLPMLALALVSHWAIPFAFGSAWAPAVSLYAILSVGRIVGSPGQLQTTLLYMQGRVAIVSKANAITAALVWAITAPFAVGFGTTGYTVGLLVANVALVITDRAVRKTVAFSYAATAACAAAFVPALLYPVVPYPYRFAMLLSLVLLAVVPSLRGVLVGLTRTVVAQTAPRWGSTAAQPGNTAS